MIALLHLGMETRAVDWIVFQVNIHNAHCRSTEGSRSHWCYPKRRQRTKETACNRDQRVSAILVDNLADPQHGLMWSGIVETEGGALLRRAAVFIPGAQCILAVERSDLT